MTDAKSSRTLLVIAMVVASAAAVATPTAAAGSTDLTVTPVRDTAVTVGETVTYEVAVRSANDGVKSGNFDVRVTDPSVANVVSASVEGSPSVGASPRITDDTASFAYAGADTAETGRVVIVTVTVEATAPGTTGISVAGDAVITDESGDRYTINASEDATLAVLSSGPTAVDLTVAGLREDPFASTQPFADQSDVVRQRVPRDGQKIAAIDVETTTDAGYPINGPVTVTVSDDEGNSPSVPTASNFAGSFIAVQGGALINDDPTGDGDATQVTTGPDGIATVLLQVDAAASDLATNVTATVPGVPNAADSSRVAFVGTTRFATASVTGSVTDIDGDPIPGAAVWTRAITWADGANRITVEPDATAAPGTAAYAAAVDSNDDTFVVTLEEFDPGSSSYVPIATDVATADELRAYEFTAFRGIVPDRSLAGFQLYHRSTDAEGSYTLTLVPAADTAGDTTVEVRTALTAGRDVGRVGNSAPAVAASSRTTTADVVVPVDVPTDTPNLSVVNLSAPATLSTSGTAQVEATVENVGTAPASGATVEYRVDFDGDGSLEPGEVVTTTSVDVASGATTSVPIEVSGSALGLSPGTVRHGVTVPSSRSAAQTSLRITESPFADGVPGVSSGQPPTDTDGDNKLEDIDGDGRFSFTDVIEFVFVIDELASANLDAQERAALDHSGDGSVGFTDVINLVFQLR